MANFKDSAVELDNNLCINDSKDNDALFTHQTSKYKFGNITFDDPYCLPRMFIDMLDENKSLVNVDTKYYYRPEIFARDYLQSADLWWLILMINGMTRHKDFCVNKAYVINTNVLSSLGDILESAMNTINSTTEVKDITLWPVRI